MNVVSVKLGERNQMVLPKEAREALGVKPGGRVMVVIDGQTVRLLPEPENWTAYIYGLGAEVWASLGGGERFLQEERSGNDKRLRRVQEIEIMLLSEWSAR